GLWEELEKPALSDIPIYRKEVDDIGEVDDSVVNQALICQETGRLFNVTQNELAFLKKHSIPLPRYYPDIRTMKRATKLLRMYKGMGTCYFCSKDIAIHNRELLRYKKIACKECHLKQVV
ncbi:hypothetical protein MYX07_01570, partial [Patescibacteria group bacterium AH-259-L07]|nr:hypothetical protein [Patescibacteria group bacterium AH-259-L07]